MSAEEQGPTARTLQEPDQLSESLAMRTWASVSGFEPWRMAVAVLYIHAKPPTMNLRTGRSASERAELRRFAREQR